MLLTGAAQVLAQDEGAETVIKSHGYSYFGDLKYPADFEHFDYVNPDAPKGGEISIHASGTFDSMNPYSRKGRAGALSSSMYESLLDENAPADEYGALYCLLCESLEYDEGKNWVIFNMRKDARFSDGTPLTAHDVVFSHYLILDQGLPSYAQAVKKRVTGAQALDDYTVKFTFADDISRRSLIDQVGALSIWSKRWYEETGARLDESRMEVSPGSGPYMLDSYDVNRNIVYKRNPDYWGADLPVNRGRHNFDTIRVEYFSDETAAFEAFKAGEYTFREETNSRQWATQYNFPAVTSGAVIAEELADGAPPNNTGFVFNLGRETLQDRRVRQAIALAYNFEWTNQSLQYGLFDQRHSYFQGTKLEARGTPEGTELEMLQSLSSDVPEEILTAAPINAHDSSPDRLNDRRNLRAAMKLLDAAGWAVGDDGIRRNAAGEKLVLEIPINSSSSATLEGILESFAQNLKLIGVQAEIQKVDPAQYTDRDRNRDYDMIYNGYRAFLGTGTGLRQMYGSSEAEFSLFNPAGLASPLVDEVIDLSLQTGDQDSQDASLRVLDRVLRHEFIMVPTWYKASHWVAYFDMYEHPEEIPPYDLGELDFWWFNEDKAAALKANGVLR
nr:extracellular solute-binding protein [Pseudooceanicola aestuarii]